jgi:hypothetical protein
MAEAAGDRLAVGDAVAAKAMSLTFHGSDNRAALEIAEPLWEELQDTPGAGPVLMRLSRPIGNARAVLNLPFGEIDLARARIAEGLGQRGAMVQALMGFGVGMLNDVPTIGRILIAAATEMARAEQQPESVARGLANLSAIDLPHDTALAIGHCREARDAARKSGNALSTALARLNFCLAAYVRGEWAEVIGLVHGDEVPAPGFGEDIPAMLDALIGVARGTPPPTLLEPQPAPSTDDEQRLAMIGALGVLSASVRGDRDRVRSEGVEVGSRLLRASGLSDDSVVGWPPVAEAVMGTGDRDAMVAVLAPLEAVPAAARPLGFRAHLHRFRAFVDALAGDDEAAVEEDLRRAVAEFEEWGSPVYAARARADLARCLAAQGRADEAAAERLAAADAYEALGADAWLAELGTGALAGEV